MSSLKEIYQKLMNCEFDCEKRGGVFKSIDSPPRGFWLPKNNVDVLFVAQMPGSIKEDHEEVGIYSKGDKVNSHHKFVKKCLLMEENQPPFHRNIMKYARLLFPDIREDKKALINRFAYSNVIKCEIAEEEPKNLAKLSKVPVETYATCCHEYLTREIQLIQPKVILALGKPAYEVIKIKYPEQKVFGLRHPSRGFSIDKERPILQKARKILKN